MAEYRISHLDNPRSHGFDDLHVKSSQRREANEMQNRHTSELKGPLKSTELRSTSTRHEIKTRQGCDSNSNMTRLTSAEEGDGAFLGGGGDRL